MENTDPSIESIYEERLSYLDSTVDTTEFAKELDNVERLQKLMPKKLRARIDPNVVISSASSLVSVAAILKHEQLHVIATKAVGFIPKIRL